MSTVQQEGITPEAGTGEAVIEARDVVAGLGRRAVGAVDHVEFFDFVVALRRVVRHRQSSSRVSPAVPGASSSSSKLSAVSWWAPR